MAEQDELEEELEEDLEDEGEGEEGKKSGTSEKKAKTTPKTFTQEQLNRIVGREKSKAVKTVEVERDALQQRLDEIDAEYEEEAKELSKGIDEDVLELMDGLSNREKVLKLRKLQGKLVTSTLKTLPKGKKPVENSDEKKQKRFNSFSIGR